MEEIWKTIKGFENYKVSNTGKVYSLDKSKVMKPWKINSGYQAIALVDKGISKRMLVHRLVALNFIDNPLNKPQVNHIDGDKLNNSVDNLEWTTASENINHNKVLGRLDTHTAREALNKVQTKAVNQLDIATGKVIATYNTISEASKSTGSQNGKITMVCQGKRNSHNGYRWEYVNKGHLNTQVKTKIKRVVNETGEETIYSSMSEASRALGKDPSTFTSHFKKKGNPFSMWGSTWYKI